MARTSYAIAIGSNRHHGRHGAPPAILAAAAAALVDAGVTIEARSPVIRSAAIGPAGRAFANGALLVSTMLDPPALLGLLKTIERDFGRRRGRRWGPRVIDLDIAMWSGGRWPAGLRQPGPGRLAVPHAELAKRDFVLGPLATIAAAWRHPTSGLRVRHMLARLPR
jgi:2-amino-4-hydroxy-6-hydroxymethyldihydropteridine diphosphokinase